MDIRSLANGVSSIVNENVPVTVLISTGFTMGTGRKQVPTYAPAVTGFGQIQALDGMDLKQLDGLNLQGCIKSLYLRGKLSGLLRPTGVGGDIVKTSDGGTWLVVKILEGWPMWTKAAILLQEPTA